MKINLPNQLSIARCFLAIVFVFFMSFTHWIPFAIAYIIFIIAAITDYWDGKIARQTKSITKFGQLIDPIADKVLMVAAFVMMMKLEELKIPGWCVVIIFAREFLVTGIRTLAAADGTIIPADPWGKLKTVLQMTYVIAFLFLATARRFFLDVPFTFMPENMIKSYDPLLGKTSLVFMMFIAIYTLYSGCEVLWKNWEKLKLD